MAGGEGTRLRPLTCGRPKPMVPVANKPVMEHIVNLLKRHEITNVAATLQYMPDLISEYFGDGDSFGVKMHYYTEQKPLGTAGSVKNAEDFLNETFIVISGDALTDIDLDRAIAFHRDKKSFVTLILKRVDNPLEYGVVVTDQDGRIIRFLEKPSWGEVFSDTVNTGIYILSPEVFRYMRRGEKFDFSRDLFPIFMKENKPMYGYITDEYWCDIGDISAYIQANADVLNGSVRVNIPGSRTDAGIWIGSDTIIDERVYLKAPAIIGSRCHVREGTVIDSYCVIGDNCTIYGNCGLKRSVVWKNTTMGGNAQLRGSIICNNVHLKQGVNTFEQSVVGQHSIIGERAIIRPSVKIWPDKYVEQGSEMNTNLVWGSKAGRPLFGNRGISGEINTDITPEFAAKLGAACGAVNANKGTFGISCDGSSGAVMIKNAFASGLVSSGVMVNDFKRLMLPAFRSAVRFYRLDGGVHVSACSSNESKLFIDFIDKSGSNIARNIERKLENIFTRDDFGRCEGDCLKTVKQVDGFDEFYLKNILHGVKAKGLSYKIAVYSSSSYVSDVIRGLLEELGCCVDLVQMGADLCQNPLDAAQLCRTVRDGAYDLGVSIEESCEKMMLVDSRGRLVTEDMFIALISMILLKRVQGGTVVVPVSASQVVERIAEELQGKVVRTKTSTRDIMSTLLGNDLKEELLEQFTLHFDSIAGLARLLDYMSSVQLSLSQLIDMLPAIHMHKQEVECSWDNKGKVIRQLIQEHTADKLETLDGVKMYKDNGWVLVLPDGERPVCSVIGESVNAEFAEELTNIYVRKVREISRS